MRTRLVRDNIAAFNGQETRGADSRGELRALLSLKLLDAAAKAAARPDTTEPYADLIEVAVEMARLHGVRWDAVERRLLDQRRKLGGYSQGNVLDTW